MILEKNGRVLSGKITRKISIIDLFILDRVKYGEVDIKYCPMDEIIGDYFTNNLQGFKLSKPKGKILYAQLIHDGPVPTNGLDPQKCVGN